MATTNIDSPSAAGALPARSTSGRMWVVLVSAALIMSLSNGMRSCLGLFLHPINVDLGVSAASFGFAMALQSIVWGISQPFIGMLGDRFGARPVLIGSTILYTGGLLLMAFGGPVLGLGAGTGVMVGLGVSGTCFGVLIGCVSRAAPADRRTQMVGLVSAAGSLATLVLAPLGQVLISAYGWQVALVIYAAIASTMAFIAMGIGREPTAVGAEPMGHSAGGAQASMMQALRGAASHRGYIAMVVAFFACGFQLMFIVTHLPLFLAICGVPPTVSATAIGIIGVTNAVGCYMFGVLGGRYSPKRLLSWIYLLRTITIVIFIASPITPVSTIMFAAVMGFLWLGVVPLVSGLVRTLFGMRYFNTLFGIAFFSHQVGAFFGAWLGGLSFNLTGSYTMAWDMMVIIGVAAAIIQWLMNDQALPDDEAQGGAAVEVTA